MDGTTAQSLYREEKARALQERRISHAQLMAEAKEAFAKMLADAQLARKGGRPKSNPNAPSAARTVSATTTTIAPAKVAVTAAPVAEIKKPVVEAVAAAPAKAVKTVSTTKGAAVKTTLAAAPAPRTKT
jgi:hypothetical protein